MNAIIYNCTLYIEDPKNTLGLPFSKNCRDIESLCFISSKSLDSIKQKYCPKNMETPSYTSHLIVYNEKGKRIGTLPITKEDTILLFNRLNS